MNHRGTEGTEKMLGLALLLTVLLAAQAQQPIPLGFYRNSVAAAAFNPGSVAGYAFDLDAQAMSGSDGSAVSSFTDSSGNARHFTMDAAGSRPYFTNAVSGLNNKKAVYFDGANDAVTNRNLSFTATNWTMFVVTHPANSTSAGEYFLDCETGRMIFVHINPDDSTTVAYYDGAFKATGSATANAQILSYVLNSSGATVYRNGTSIGTGTFTQQAIGAMTAVGSRFSTDSQNFKGVIARMIFYQGALSTADRQYVERGLGTIYGISVP